jgi:DnaJ-class molecular chaperone
MSYYVVLGILPGATADEVRQAYVRLAKMYHPDKNKSPDATVKMAEINVAYETLCDIERRKEYDLENDIAVETGADAAEDYEDDEIGQEEPSPGWSPGKCVKCNFVNNSGVFVCSTCGHVFDPHAKAREEEDFELDEQASEETLSEIIRCPRCNEINKYSGGSSCWQCGLQFEIDELA